MSRGRLPDGEVRRLVIDIFNRRPAFSDVDAAHHLSKKLGRKISGQVVGYHRKVAGIPARKERMK